MLLVLFGASPTSTNADGQSVYDICIDLFSLDILEFCVKAYAHYTYQSARKILNVSNHVHDLKARRTCRICNYHDIHCRQESKYRNGRSSKYNNNNNSTSNSNKDTTSTTSTLPCQCHMYCPSVQYGNLTKEALGLVIKFITGDKRG